MKVFYGGFIRRFFISLSGKVIVLRKKRSEKLNTGVKYEAFF